MTAPKLDRLRIAFFGPFVRAYFRFKSYRRNRRRYPIEWKSPRDIMFMDLENYDVENPDFELNKEFVADIADGRDKLLERIRRNSIVSMTILAILITDYFSIDLKFSLLGVEITKFVFFRELLFMVSCGLSAHTLLMQSNQYTLENAMQYVIKTRFPVELQHIYASKFVPGMTFGRYAPTNLPYMAMVKANFYISVVPAIVALIALISGLIGLAVMIALLLHNIWENPSVPFWSRGSVILMAIFYAYGFLYVSSTRLMLPYKNYLRVERMATLREYFPAQYQAEYGNEYSAEIAEDEWMRARGYQPIEK